MITKVKAYIWTTDKDVNVKAILAVVNTSWTVVYIGPEKIQVYRGFEPMTFCDTGAVLYQLS